MLKIDLHIHTVLSGHAFGTIYDVIREAETKGMDMIAITDHGPALEGVSSEIIFNLGHRAPKQIGNLRILWGCEANVIGSEGNIDLEDWVLNKLDFVLVGLHGFNSYKDQGIDKNTEALKKALLIPKVKILSHPNFQQYPVHWEELVEFCLDNNVLPEFNLSYLKSQGIETFKKLVEIVKRKKGKLIVNSDAHFIHEIGDDSLLQEHWDELGMTDDIIINNFPHELKQFLGII